MRHELGDPPPEVNFRRWHKFREYVTVFRLTLPTQIFWLLVYLVAFLLVAPKVFGHEIHLAESAVNYSDWTNRANKGCCNNQDCAPAKEGEVRLSPVAQVQIEGKWCPVLPEHYLKSGNAPDGSRAHVCVRINFGYADFDAPQTTIDPCSRLLCFQPPALF